jgi:hypothetical protein
MTEAYERAVAHVRSLGAAGLIDAPITVSFHPDRRLADGRTVVEHLVAEGRYRSQFETGISNGGLGGDRDRWEHRMFGGAYAGRTAGRPVYGGLNLAGWPDGASPRFGSCHLVLAPHVAARTTFSHGDSVTEPSVVGTADTFGGIWAALLGDVARTGSACGLPASSPEAWVAALAEPKTSPGRALDDYVEAQIHGGLDLAADVTAVVADPSFAGTPVEAALARLAPRLTWHQGFALDAADFPADLRGPVTPPLAAAVAARYGVTALTAEVVGRAAAEFGSSAAARQLLKYLWHILVLRGHALSGQR